MLNLIEQFYYRFQKHLHPCLVREEFVYKDGGTIHLDWTFSLDKNGSKVSNQELNSPIRDNKPIMILIPGFCNDSTEIYM